MLNLCLKFQTLSYCWRSEAKILDDHYLERDNIYQSLRKLLIDLLKDIRHAGEVTMGGWFVQAGFGIFMIRQ